MNLAYKKKKNEFTLLWSHIFDCRKLKINEWIIIYTIYKKLKRFFKLKNLNMQMNGKKDKKQTLWTTKFKKNKANI